MIPIRDSVRCERRPLVLAVLIAVNAGAFLFQQTLSPAESIALAYHYGVVPLRYSDPAWAELRGLDPGDYFPFLSSVFLHGGWLHILINMWSLWIFGRAVEDRLGPLRFAAFYLLCGLAAGATHAFFASRSPLPALGASGAIAGVIGAYATTFPRAQVVLLVPVLFYPLFFRMPALLFALIWFALQILEGAQQALAPAVAGGIAWWAHVGGFLSGIALMRLMHSGARGPWFQARS